MTIVQPPTSNLLQLATMAGWSQPELQMRTVHPRIVLACLVPALLALAPAATQPTETQKIEQLITAVRELKDASFVRNGKEYTAAEAADHLQSKWDKAKDQITTAAMFIEKIASKSSASGKP